MKKHTTREAWLQAAITELAKDVNQHGQLPSNLHAIVSWPKGSTTAIGQCFSSHWTEDKSVYVSISPILGKPVEVLATLLHELVHALGIKGHGSDFKVAATALGLEGKMRATVAGKELTAKLTKIAESLGAYPHQPMKDVKVKKEKSGAKTAIRFHSPVDEKYACWVSPKQAEEHGAPICPISGETMVEG